MDGHADGSAGAQDATPDRREHPVLRFAVDRSGGRLREVLAEVDWQLVDLEYSSVGRVRLVLTEILARTQRDAEVHIEILVLWETIRIELSGPSLAMPENLVARPGDDPSFPSWFLTNLVDRWGIDHRKSERAIWLLLERG
jgi:hypothetical protein